ncbi:MAG: hypothetical protein ABJJ03_14260, partial [Sulfitobacter sp.]
MRISLTGLLVASLALGACGVVRDSALNPGNWFGRSTAEPIEAVADKPINPLIPQTSSIFARQTDDEKTYVGKPFDEIVDLTVERTIGGAIIRATGRADRQG